jgi:hypothetical protein
VVRVVTVRAPHASPRACCLSVPCFGVQAANAERDDGSPTQLFLHVDEFEVEDVSFISYFPADAYPTALHRYYAVWRSALLPILFTPNVHLIITGRPVALAVLGLGGGGGVGLRSPTAAHHVVLDTLKVKHLREVRCMLKNQFTATSCTVLAFGVALLAFGWEALYCSMPRSSCPSAVVAGAGPPGHF